MQGDQVHSVALLHPGGESKNFLAKLYQHIEAFSGINRCFFSFPHPSRTSCCQKSVHLLEGKHTRILTFLAFIPIM